MWRASGPFLNGPPPWPPRMPADGEAPPDPRSFLRVRPWHTLRTLARAHTKDPRLRMIIERFATYAGADPRRAPAVLAVAGYVEHAFGAWHVRGGIYELVRAIEARLLELGGSVSYDTRVEALLLSGGAVGGVSTLRGPVEADAVVWSGDALVLDRLLGRPTQPEPERSLSGLALMLGLRGHSSDLVHHTITFPADYDAEFDDVFVAAPAAARPDAVRQRVVRDGCVRGAGRGGELVRARQRAVRGRALG